jgi:hypothetical protein
VAAFDVTTKQLTAWSPTVGTASGGVKSMAIGSGGIVYVGGNFVSAGGASRKNLAGLDPTTGLATAFNPGPDNEVLTLAYKGGINGDPNTLYAGGLFTHIVNAGSAVRTYAASFNTDTGALLAWNPSPNGAVHSILPLGSGSLMRTYMGGVFWSLGGQPRSVVGAVDGNGIATPWNPAPDGPVYSMTVSGTTFYLGGDFQNVGGQPRSRLAIVSAGAVTSWSIGTVSAPVYQLVLRSGMLYAGGTFLSVQGFPHSAFAAISEAVVGVPETVQDHSSPRRQEISAAPNPFTRNVTLTFEAPDDVRVTIHVHDCRGRLVSRLGSSRLAPGRQEVSWDGVDDAGEMVPSGIYFVTVRGAGVDRRARVVRVR